MISFDALLRTVAGSEFWESYLLTALYSDEIRIHLGVFAQPYFAYILDGSKSIESRFSIHPIAPYGAVDEGDILLVKRAGGKISGICRVRNVWYYQIREGTFESILDKFGTQLRLTPEFISSRKSALYSTLIQFDCMYGFEPFAASKKDRRGWVVIHDPVRGKCVDWSRLSAVTIE